MMEDIDKILFKEEDILFSVDLLARTIEKNYIGRELTIVAILNGSFVFLSDLVRRLRLPLRVECIYAQSYHGGTASSGEVTILTGSGFDVTGSNVLIVDDILDSGLTLSKVREEMAARRAREIRTCVLIRKNKFRSRYVEADYWSFDCDDEFVVGYGLDFRGYYRNLPFIASLKEKALHRP